MNKQEMKVKANKFVKSFNARVEVGDAPQMDLFAYPKAESKNESADADHYLTFKAHTIKGKKRAMLALGLMKKAIQANDPKGFEEALNLAYSTALSYTMWNDLDYHAEGNCYVQCTLEERTFTTKDDEEVTDVQIVGIAPIKSTKAKKTKAVEFDWDAIDEPDNAVDAEFIDDEVKETAKAKVKS